MKMEQTQCSETSAHKIQMLGNYPEEMQQGAECLKMVLPCYRTEFNLRARADVKLFAL
jgi:hypothetical protein